MKTQKRSLLLFACLFLFAGCTRANAQENPLYRFELQIDDILYQFPLSFSDFTASGWEYVGELSAETEEPVYPQLAPGSYSPVEQFQKGSLTVYTLVWNTGHDTVPISECQIAGLFLDQTQMDNAPGCSVTLPGGIEYGGSTLDQILSICGEPTEQKSEDSITRLTYEYQNYQRIDLGIDQDTGLLNEIDLQNMPVSGQEEAIPASSQTGARTLPSYRAPKELGEELSSYLVKFANDLYQLPAPVSAFLDNGWALNPETSDSAVDGLSFGWASLAKDGQEFSAIAYNYSSDSAPIENCFVTSMTSDTDSDQIPVTLPGGITLGLLEKDLLVLLKDYDYTTEEPEPQKDASSEGTEEEEQLRTYLLEEEKNSLNYIKISVDVPTSSVTGIEVSHVPDSL